MAVVNCFSALSWMEKHQLQWQTAEFCLCCLLFSIYQSLWHRTSTVCASPSLGSGVMCFKHSTNTVSPNEEMFKVEQLIFHIKSNKPRCFLHLIRMCPACLSLKIFQVHLNGRNWGRFKIHWCNQNYIYPFWPGNVFEFPRKNWRVSLRWWMSLGCVSSATTQQINARNGWMVGG